ncbi:MAG: phosphoenolpyruvate synthase [Myxococcales bacterium]|nr:phosphoenolpyruvate synthase [Myxococcales bacterium]
MAKDVTVDDAARTRGADESAWIRPLERGAPQDASGERTLLGSLGGKGLNLARMTALGLPVPPGFVITTAAYRLVAAGASLDHDALRRVGAGDVEGARREGARARAALREAPLPDALARAIVAAWRRAGPEHAYAVRSSATLEDLAEASFAGQQDTYLGVRGEDELLRRVRDCWASLFTDRALLYRRRQGFTDDAAELAVVVQRLIAPRVSGILFTADPVSHSRAVASIDASYGLGEALVSGRVDADLYRVRRATRELVELRLGEKAIAIWPDGQGTVERPVELEARRRRALDDDGLRALLELADTVERARGAPQDIEYTFDEDGRLWLLQTRDITSLYPMPTPRGAGDGLHVYLSFGHLQVMTEPLHPLAIDFFRYAMPFGSQRRCELIVTAGDRMYFDATSALSTFPTSAILPRVFHVMDRQMVDALQGALRRPDFARGAPKSRRLRLARVILAPMLRALARAYFRRDPERARADLVAALAGFVDDAQARVAAAEPGAPRLRAAIERTEQLFYTLIPSFPPLVLTGVVCWKRLERRAPPSIGPARVEALTRGLEGNITTQMDLEVGDLGDLAREVPGLLEQLAAREGPACVEGLRGTPGSAAFFAAWDEFIARYGHRCPGEINLAQPRWRDDPTSLVRSIVSIGRGAREPGAHRRHHAALAEEAERVGRELVAAAPIWRRGQVSRMVRRVREYLALREHGKFYALLFFELVRETALEAAALAVAAGSLDAEEDAFFLDFDELLGALERGDDLREQVRARRARLERSRGLRPPRVLTSEGEHLRPPPPTSLPPGALAGIAASGGVACGRARVVLDPRRDELEDGEILVAPFTDPGWTPLFIHAAGLVMEVGGLMTHGSVIAREYGIPAVVGVDGCTTKIRSGQRIRVDGGTGIVTILEDDEEDEDDEDDEDDADAERRDASAEGGA